jgi:hypothetical protein
MRRVGESSSAKRIAGLPGRHAVADLSTVVPGAPACTARLDRADTGAIRWHPGDKGCLGHRGMPLKGLQTCHAGQLRQRCVPLKGRRQPVPGRPALLRWRHAGPFRNLTPHG